MTTDHYYKPQCPNRPAYPTRAAAGATLGATPTLCYRCGWWHRSIPTIGTPEAERRAHAARTNDESHQQ